MQFFQLWRRQMCQQHQTFVENDQKELFFERWVNTNTLSNFGILDTKGKKNLLRWVGHRMPRAGGRAADRSTTRRPMVRRKLRAPPLLNGVVTICNPTFPRNMIVQNILCMSTCFIFDFVWVFFLGVCSSFHEQHFAWFWNYGVIIFGTSWTRFMLRKKSSFILSKYIQMISKFWGGKRNNPEYNLRNVN